MDHRDKIRDVLKLFGQENLFEAAVALLSAMGYVSERTGEEYWPRRFCDAFTAGAAGTRSEKIFIQCTKKIAIVVQVTRDEISPNPASEKSLQFERSRAKSIVFVVSDLMGAAPTRGTYAMLAREISKRFPMPIVALFRHGRKLTLGYVRRRPSRAPDQHTRDVLQQVAILNEINVLDPHRADLDVLGSLSLNGILRWAEENETSSGFDGILEAWTEMLSVTRLEKKFYDELYEWFLRACAKVQFPHQGTRVISSDAHVIRLITRLLFVWFLREKGLVHEDLFVESRMKAILKNYDRANGSDYYPAVLQNLFFATLNTEIPRRGFADPTDVNVDPHGKYHHADLLADKSQLSSLLERTPFINGGLFDYSEQEVFPESPDLVGCSSDNLEYRIIVPNHLFFGEKGILTLLARYKFTVEESTPIECEVALDPELLGKVFENLLAVYNPETQEIARKKTGSYYTPRHVVDYMVEEALVAYLTPPPPPQPHTHLLTSSTFVIYFRMT